jgi:hypothetical protein
MAQGEHRGPNGWDWLTLFGPAALALYLFQVVEDQDVPPHHHWWVWPAIWLCLAAAAVGLLLLVVRRSHNVRPESQPKPKTEDEPMITPTFGVPGFVADLPAGSTYSASAWAPTAPGEPAVFRAEVLHPNPKPLVNRVVDLANKVHACAPGGHLQPPFKYPSSYGIKQDMSSFVAAIADGEHIADEQATVTDELWTDMREIIEEMGRNGYRDYRLEPFLSRRPEPGECVHLSAQLFNQASMMANS